MRLSLCCLALTIAASPSSGQTVVPGSPLLRLDRIHPYTDSISLVLVPRDSAARVAGTLVRELAIARVRGEPVFRETQHYSYASGHFEDDTLDVATATLEPVRIFENNASSGHDLRFHDGRLSGAVWSADSGRRAVDVPLASAFFHGMMTEAFLAAFPLIPNGTLRLPVAETPRAQVHMLSLRVTDTTTLRTANGRVGCLVVQESPTAVAWVSRADGHLVRLHWTLPNGTAIWKLPTRDVPFLDAHDLTNVAGPVK